MVQLSPDTRAGDWDACAGYHYDDTTIDGFSHTHLSGTGCADLADILFHPTTREIVLHDGACVLQPYFFSHGDEKASCGYYAVELPGENIRVELTAAPRTGVHRYTFTGKGPRQVVVDLMHTIAEEQVDMRELRTTAPDEIAGMRRTQGWVPDQYVFFSARFSEPFADVRLLGDKQAVLTFAPDTETLTIAVGLSSVSAENARLNSVAEVPELDFDAVHARAAALWREALGDIVVEGGSRDEMVNFYTAQYHTKLTPNLMSDVNGEYRRHDQRIARMPQGGALLFDILAVGHFPRVEPVADAGGYDVSQRHDPQYARHVRHNGRASDLAARVGRDGDDDRLPCRVGHCRRLPERYPRIRCRKGARCDDPLVEHQ